MAWTATTLKAALQAYLQTTETSYVAMQDAIIQQVEDRISKAVILPSSRTSANIVLTAGLSTAPLPDDFLAPFSLLISSAGDYTPVAIADVALMRELYPNPLMVGIPRWYAMYDSATIIMAPTPSAEITGWLNYFYKPESIVTADTSWLGDNAENCLLYGCLSESYSFLKGEADLMKLYEDRFLLALKDLQTLGEGLDMGDAYRFGEKRVPR